MTVWKTEPMLILASSSQTRKTLLRGAGLRFEVVPADIDERAVESRSVAEGAGGRAVAQMLAEAKAVDVSGRHPGAVVIGCDQTLALDGNLLHKPATMADAAAQLDRLRGRQHRLHAAAALAIGGRAAWSQVETAELVMRDFSTAERDAVLAAEGEAALGSVGAYRLEGPSIRLFESVRGDYFTILGLPLLPLLAALRAHAPQTLEGFT